MWALPSPLPGSRMRAFAEVTSCWSLVGPYRLHVRAPRRAPPPEAPVVVLVHGLGVSSRYMVPLAVQLGAWARVLAPDLPGSGRSPAPERALSIPELAAVLGDWIEREVPAPPVLVGNSMGCQIIAELAATRPDRVAGAVLQAPTMDPEARSWRAQMGRWLLDAFREPPSLALVVARDYLAFGARRMLDTLSLALAHPMEATLPRVRCPALVVRGARDPVAPRRWCRRAAELLPSGRLVESAGAHALHWSHPGDLAALVRGFTSRNGA